MAKKLSHVIGEWVDVAATRSGFVNLKCAGAGCRRVTGEALDTNAAHRPLVAKHIRQMPT